MAVSLVNCSKNNSADCVPADQRDSLMAPVHGFPIQVVADQQFTSDEISQITAAVAEWNKTGQALLGHPVFTLVTHTVPDGVRDADPKDCSKEVGTEDSFFIVREESDSHWETIGFSSQIPGATLRCHQGDDFEHQIMMVNVLHIKESQIQNVVLHELGHAVGLDHSCKDKDGTDSFKNCTSFPDGHPYKAAVMYPWLSSDVDAKGNPVTKSQLQDNDKTRVSCLYPK